MKCKGLGCKGKKQMNKEAQKNRAQHNKRAHIHIYEVSNNLPLKQRFISLIYQHRQMTSLT